MTVSGEEAKLYNAVSLSDYTNVNKGELLAADEITGEVRYRDTPESEKTVTLGERAIKIIRKVR